MRENIQKGYIRIADITPIQDDIRIADIPKLYEIGFGTPEIKRNKIIINL